MVAVKGTGSVHAKWSSYCGNNYEEIEDGTYRFHVETTGALEPGDLFKDSIRVLRNKLNGVSF